MRSGLGWTALSAVLLLIVSTNGGCAGRSRDVKRMDADYKWSALRAEMSARLAMQRLDQSRTDEAIASLLKAIRLDPKNPTYHRLLAQCRLETGNVQAAAAAIDRAVACGDDSAESSYVRGLVAEHRGRLDQALEHYRAARERRPESVDYAAAEAECLIAVGRSADARRLLDEQIDSTGADPRLLLVRSVAGETQGDWKQATADLADAKAAVGTESRLWDERYALLLVRTGRYAEALKLLEAEMELGSASFTGTPELRPETLRAAARSYLHTGRPRDARRLLTAHLEKMPTDARAWCLLAETGAALGDADLALQSAERGEALEPGRPHWNLVRAYVAWDAGDCARARAAIEKLLSRHPDHAIGRYLLADCSNAPKNPSP